MQFKLSFTFLKMLRFILIPTFTITFLLYCVTSKETEQLLINNLRQSSQIYEMKSKNLESINGVLGIHPDPNYTIRSITHKITKPIPEFFDARTFWPFCKKTIGWIRNQGDCKTDWAFSAASVMSDRLCIETEGNIKFIFSPEDILECCNDCGYGCRGGYPAKAWEFWYKQGIVSGGDCSSNKGCKPYSSLAFGHMTSPNCTRTCHNKLRTISYKADKRFGSSIYKVNSSVEQIQYEIMTNGPVQATFMLYYNFPYFYNDRDIYQEIFGEAKGLHSVKILGWGEQNRTPYWLVADSVGMHLGDKGFFKIKRGNNFCGIEENILAGRPVCSAVKLLHYPVIFTVLVVLHNI